MNIPIASELSYRVYSSPTLPERGECLKQSMNLPGTIWYGGYYIIWQVSNREIYTFLQSSEVPSILSARSICQALTGRENIGWTYSRMAREVSEWLGYPQASDPVIRKLLPHWHYQACVPSFPVRAVMYDLVSAYWQFASMLPSPHVQYIDGRAVPVALPNRIEDRWNETKRAIERHKRLRVTFSGVNSAGWDDGRNSRVYRVSRGKRVNSGNMIGRLQPLGIVTVRATYEVTQLQHEQARSVYSNADCVVTEDGRRPIVWEDLGLRFRVKAQAQDGVQDNIHNINAYSIGGVQTENFAAYSSLLPTPYQCPPIEPPFIAKSLIYFRDRG